MADIQTYLDYILSKIYGKDVRQAIVDAINQCYADATAGITPQIDFEEITNGTRVIITVGSISNSFDVISPSVDVSKEGAVTTVTFTDADGTHTATINDGVRPQVATASTASAMTDTSLIYVYVGSETGYTSGNWYYHNGSSWVSGGAYNATALVTDKTLLNDGEAADAKVVGEKISDIDNALGYSASVGVNKWNPNEEEADKAISGAQSSYGNTYTENGYKTSGFILAVQGDIVRWDYRNSVIEQGELLNRGTNVFKIAEYDSEKNCLVVSSNWASLPYTVQNANTAFIRIAVSSFPTNSVIFGDSSTSQIRYTPYKETADFNRIKQIEADIDDLENDLVGAFDSIDTVNNKLNLLEYGVSENKWNPNASTANMAVSQSSSNLGELTATEGYTTSDFISISYGETFRWDYSTSSSPTESTLLSLSDSVFRVAEYDENKNCLLVTSNWAQLPYAVSNQDTAYIRVTVSTFPTNSIVLNDPHLTQIYYKPYKEDFNRISDIESDIEDLKNHVEEVDVVIPDTIYGVVGHPFSIYYYNIFKKDSLEGYHFTLTGASAHVQNLGDRVRFDCETAAIYAITIKMRKDGTANVASKSITVRIIAESIPTIKAIFIGDSFTDGGKMQSELKHLMGNSLTFYGTRSSNTADSTGTVQTILDEGRSSWSWTDYCTQASKSNVINAFWDGSKFNFSYYMQQNPSFADVTDVFLLSGPNDSNSDDTNYKAYYQEIVNSIKTFSQSVRIHCMMPLTCACLGYAWGVRNFNGGEEFRYNMLKFGQDVIDLFTSDPQCYVVPTHVNFDKVYDFPRTQVAVNDRTPTLIDVFNDNVHPNEYGYYCMADMIFGHIVAKCQGN